MLLYLVGSAALECCMEGHKRLLRITENALHSLPEKGYRWFQAQSDCYIRQRVGKAALIAFRAISSALDVDPASLQ